MAKNFKINVEKTLNSVLFILEKLGGKSDFHKLFKILYFADQKHLARYGMPVSGDYYIAMKDGPVPSRVYDVLKYLRNDESVWYTISPDCHKFFEVRGNHYVFAKEKPNLDELAQSDVECLLESINENKNLSFDALRQKSHKTAWDAAKNDEMNVVDIAREGGANDEMLKYIVLNLENQSIFSGYAIFQ